MKKILIVGLLVLAMCFVGCGSVFNPKYDTISEETTGESEPIEETW